MSVMSPVDSRVLTMLSPSPPCGRLSTLMDSSGYLALNAFASASAVLTVDGSLSTRYDSAVPSPSLSPRLPGVHAVTASRPDTAASNAVRPILMGVLRMMVSEGRRWCGWFRVIGRCAERAGVPVLAGPHLDRGDRGVRQVHHGGD